MKNRLFSPARKEAGFTLIELLTVIVIIGILAAIAIPLFASQKARAQDSQTISDVRNIAVQAESFLVDTTKTFDDVTKANIAFKSSPSVSWNISGKTSLGGYCIVANNPAGKKYKTDVLTYDSKAGGVGRNGGACDANGSTNNPVSPSGSTANSVSGVGSDVANSTPVSFTASGSGYTGSLQTFSVPADGTYKIEAWGASGGNGSSYAVVGGSGAYASGVLTLSSGQKLSVLVGQAGTSNILGGGGGGTFVATGPTNTATPLVVAGGGGGAGSSNGMPGTTSTSASGSGQTSSGINGNGGGGWYSGGGGGWYSAGGNSGGGAYPGNGGNTQPYGGGGYVPVDGGYGGGGAGTTYTAGAHAGAGGGGYSGGAPGTAGGGGGSYVATTYNTAVTSIVFNNTDKAQTGHGKVVITRIS